MKIFTFALALLGASAAWGQDNQPTSTSDYLGPQVLSRGAGSIGQRAGKDVDLRFYGNATGVYDTGFNPVSVDGSGGIPDVGGLFGVELGLGAYGRHTFRHGLLGLDYQGSYRHYQRNQYFNGANQQLTLGYTWEKSRRIIYHFQGSAGSSAYANALTLGLPAPVGGVDSTSILFDNRTDYLGSNADMTYVASQRTSYTIGGNFNRIYRQSSALAGVRSYGFRGSVEHRFSTQTSAGFTYQRSHYEFPGLFGGSDMDNFDASISRKFGRSWEIDVSGGIYYAQVEGVTQVNLEPAIALIFGVNHISVPFYRVNVIPSIKVSLQKQFRNAVWGAQYNQFVSPGNGVYLTSRQQNAETSFSYSGIRRWNFAIRAGYGRLSDLAQNLQPYSQYEAGTNAAFTLTDWVHISAGYSVRHQDVQIVGFNKNGTHTSLSIVFSPGNIPISFR